GKGVRGGGEGGGLRRTSCGLSDLQDDEFRFNRHRRLAGRAWVLRQRGLRAARERKERQRGRDRLFGARLHRGFRRGGGGARSLRGQVDPGSDTAAGGTG